jgi:mannose-6-phosphate isomerase-like protein (cupin superfamily)
MAQPLVARLADSEPVAFGPLSFYNKLIGDGVLPMFTGVQTCAPDYQTAVHWHPYAEYLFVLEGVMEAWVVGEEARPLRLEAGDMIALPADTPHAFRNPGPGTLRLLGIHQSPERIVNRDANPPQSSGDNRTSK